MENLILMKANMKHKKGTYIGISILMMIITLSFTIIVSINDNLKKELVSADAKADVGDVVTFISDDYANGPMQEQLLQNKDTERIKDLPSITFVTAKINEEKLKSYLQVLNAADNTTAFRVYNENQDGFVKDPEPLAQGEFYAPLCFQALYGCKVGDVVTVDTKEGVKTFTIKAFVEDPFLGAYVMGVKEAYISEQDFQSLSEIVDDIELDKEPNILAYHLIHIYQKQPATLSVAKLKKSLNDQCQVINYSYATLSKHDSQEYTLMLPQIYGDILYVFVGLLFVIVLIVMGHSISTGIEMDYVNLGVLKSQGFTKGRLRKVLVLQYLVAEVFGAILGILISIPLIRIMGKIFQQITGLLATNEVSIGTCGLFTLALVILGGIFVYIKTAKVVKISPVRAISGGHENVYFDHHGTKKISKRCMTLKLSLRQLTSDKRQYIGIILIVSILTYFLMSMTILTAGIDVNTIFELFGGVTCDIKMEYTSYYDNEMKEEIVDAVNEMSKVTYAMNEVNRYVIVDGTEYNTQIYDVPEDFKSIITGRAPLYDNEILITELIADTYNVGIGDELPVAFQDKEENYVVSGIYTTTVDVGKCIGFSLAGVQRIADIQPHYGYLRVEDKENLNEIVEMLNQTYGKVLKAEVSDNTQGLTELINTCLDAVTIFIFVISIFFAFVVVSMVCKKTFLKERQDIGIYKAMGFTVSKLRMGFALRFLFVSLIGCGLGVVLSILFNAKMMDALLSSCGVTNFTANMTWITLLGPTSLVAICFFVFSYLAAHRIKSVAVRELVVE